MCVSLVEPKENLPVGEDPILRQRPSTGFGDDGMGRDSGALQRFIELMTFAIVPDDAEELDRSPESPDVGSGVGSAPRDGDSLSHVHHRNGSLLTESGGGTAEVRIEHGFPDHQDRRIRETFDQRLCAESVLDSICPGCHGHEVSRIGITITSGITVS
jgi:hypothetical protein